jgi:hypothetical protein
MKKMAFGTDRARRVLLGTIIGYTGTSPWANREKKNSNLLIRYPTFFLLEPSSSGSLVSFCSCINIALINTTCK